MPTSDLDSSNDKRKNFAAMKLTSFLGYFCCLFAAESAFSWQPARLSVPPPPREFRAAWVASVHNIDWPNQSGLSANQQKSQLIAILNQAQRLHLNAIILQIRPNGDALYASKYEPWSNWLTGTMGKNPGYDPLAFAISQAHARGIEVHAWFNPFRAKASASQELSSSHLGAKRPDLTRRSGSQLWFDPGSPETRKHAMKVILDVVKRYDIDGVHLDDYFYPYPAPGKTWSTSQFSDAATFREYGSGNLLQWRRNNVDKFVSDLYSEVKSAKSWVRVGISPFGIWRPGVPNGIEAGIDSYEQLSADSRKWLAKGWVDYLAPQLYWRCSPKKQSFPLLLSWWREQSNSRPVWPGIASSRIQSSEDPGRPASEIIAQIKYSRSIGNIHNGHLFWSMKSLMQNRGGINKLLSQIYTAPALPPSMPWSGSASPSSPEISVTQTGSALQLNWDKADRSTRKWIVQLRFGNQWQTRQILDRNITSLNLGNTSADAIAITPVSYWGNLGKASAIVR